MFFAIHRNFYQNNNRRHHYQHNSSHHHQHDLDCCHRLRQSTHERPIRSFASSHSGDNQVVPSNRTSEDAVSGMNLSSNERLPSAVLLAKARLVERLRGVLVSGNRRSGRALSGNYEREYIAGDDLRLVDAGDWGSGSLAVGSPSAMLTSQTERPQSLLETKKKPPGLSQAALDSLQPEIFSSRERILSMESSTCVPRKDYWDCTICLDSFKEGDKLTRLPCGHRFHSTCLNPWVRTCGDCPYCRRGIRP
ncbi:hypothetical protein SLEP1_g50552 [Rubroshorea leprosula]|uniref:RING-type domain-containing protein n=1 Tax=Rubroshorea leprosula TaxID=152421 RepID=A0AAV5M3K5_9ROSI|nr:hypothetical protein SLEP1_g50552 [Rubroshorea leprosula]